MRFEFSRAARAVLASAALALSFAGGAAASTLTGEALDTSPFPRSTTQGPSTNLANYELTLDGTNRPHVLLLASRVGEVELQFFNNTNSQAFFEIRIDGIATGSTPHPVYTGDTIHLGGVSLDNRSSANLQVPMLIRTFTANQFVDVRLALGGERQWDFDWTRFDATTAPIPLPAAGWLLIGGLGALVAVRRRKPAA